MMEKEKLKQNLRSGGFGIISALLAGLVTLLVLYLIAWFLLSWVDMWLNYDIVSSGEFLNGMKRIFLGNGYIIPIIFFGLVILGYLGGIISPKIFQRNWWKSLLGPIFMGSGLGILWIGFICISGIWILPLIGK